MDTLQYCRCCRIFVSLDRYLIRGGICDRCSLRYTSIYYNNAYSSRFSMNDVIYIKIWSLNTERLTMIWDFAIHQSSYIKDVKQLVSKITGISFENNRLYHLRENPHIGQEIRPSKHCHSIWHPLNDFETIEYHYSITKGPKELNYYRRTNYDDIKVDKVDKYMVVENKTKISIMCNKNFEEPKEICSFEIDRSSSIKDIKEMVAKIIDINCISTFRLNFLTKTVELKFQNFRLIRDVKIHIQKEFNIRVGDQVLIYKGKKLMENQRTRDVFLENQMNSLRDVSISLVIEKKPFMLRIEPQIRSMSWFSISINDSDNIEEVKQQIQAKTDIPIQNIHLIDQKTQDILCDTKKVEDYKFLDYSNITLQRKLVIRLHFAKDNRIEERFEILPGYEERTVLDLLEEIRESFLPKEMNVEEIRDRIGTTKDTLITNIYEIDFRIKKTKKCSIM
uniref:Ubiquitin-like domain-containing protein n=1 Tax=Clytia hemisphaerica TaxID=252671 RepID=A0A7M5ULB3_9CNID